MFIKLIHTLFFYFLTALSYFIITSIALCFVPFVHPRARPFHVAARLWGKFLAFFSGVKVKVSGIGNIPRNKPVIFAANHQAAADILLVLTYLPVNFRFVVKKELFKLPIFGFYLKRAGYFSIDRRSIMGAHRTLEKIIQSIGSGESILVFPEGTRTRTGKLGKFRPGSFLPALKSGAPIVPVAISGSFNIIPPGTWLIHPSPVKLSVGKPIYIRSETEYNSKVEKVREAIAKML